MSARSKERKKKVLSFLMGPPRVAPNWFDWKGALSRSMGLPKTSNFSKWSFAFRLLSRKYQKAFPRNSLVPLLVTMLTTPPEALPNSAE